MAHHSLTPEARSENALTLAAALNIDPDLAAELLVAEVIITADVEDPFGTQLGDDLAFLLRRTISSVGRDPAGPDEGRAIEVVIGACQPRMRGLRLQVNIESDRIIAGLKVQKATRSANVPAFFIRLAACYVAALALQASLGKYAFESPSDPFILRFSEIGLLPKHCGQDVDLGRAYLAGAGAIGNGLLWAMEHVKVRGHLTIADDDKVGPGNLNRQVLFGDDDLDLHKAVRLAENAGRLVPDLELDPKTDRLQALRTEGPWLRRLIVAVDSRRARRALQSEMPGEVFDASTTDIREVVIYHNRQPTEAACLSCIYARDTAEYTREDHIAEHLGVPVIEVRKERITSATAQLIALRYPHVDPASIKGLAFDTLFKRLCAEAALTTPEGKRVLAPFAFVSCLAGTLLAIEIVRRQAGVDVCDNYWRLSAWHPPIARRRVLQPRQAACEFCGDVLLRSVSDQLWTRSVT